MLIISSILFMLWILTVSSRECESGWYGVKCQFKCRCQSSKCNTDGSCETNNRCAERWFGHKCQYSNEAYSSKLSTEPRYTDLTSSYYSDRTKCYTFNELKTVEFLLVKQSAFTWMRISVSKSDVITKLLLTFKKDQQSPEIVQCVNQRVDLVDNKTIDVKCQLHHPIQSVILKGEIIKYMCSVYINGGRNVALQGITNSSSSLPNSPDHARAVDGNSDGNYNGKSCTHTKDSDKMAWWTLSLDGKYLIDRFVLFNRVDCCRFRLTEFSLIVYDYISGQWFNYTGPKDQLDQYTVLPSRALVVNALLIRPKTLTILTLCEVEVYGDCVPGKWDLSCSQDCDSACPDNCNMETGQCSTQCIGFSNPPSCTAGCLPGRWGVNCVMECDLGCYRRSCDKFSGYCSEGCLGFGNPPYCTEDCMPGYYGNNCSQECPSNCHSLECDSVTGECLQCKDGYKGKFCNDVCPSGMWGRNCTMTCDRKCYDTCHHFNGTCHLGCQGYKNPPVCSLECNSGFYGKNCTSECPVTCVNQRCNSTTGQCFACVGNYYGLMCNQERSANEDMKQGIIIYTSIAVVIFSIVITLITCIVRKGYNSSIGIEKEDIHDKKSKIQNEIELHSKEKSDNKEKLTQDSESTYLNLPIQSFQDTAVEVKSLMHYINNHDSDFWTKQFQSVPSISDASSKVAEEAQNKNKNRYKNIRPYDHNRIHLKVNSSMNEEDYINASYVKGFDNEERFIASQGPNKVVINDFVRMLWEQEVEKVVMLTLLVEEGKCKCEQYWPDQGTVQFGHIKVKLLSVQKYADYIIRTIKLVKLGGESHTLIHFQYLSWPDKGVPQSPCSLVQLYLKVTQIPSNKPILVHCSAGAGRTGTYIALHNVIRQAKFTGSVDFLQTLKNIRDDRMCMIQTAAQYEVLHITALVGVSFLRYVATVEEAKTRIKTHQDVKEEFETLSSVSKYLHGAVTEISEAEDDVYQNVRKSQCISHKRFSSILQKNSHRPILSKESSDLEDFINAVLLPGVSRQRQFILTQIPPPTTVLDFWRLVSQYQVKLIVAFDVNESNVCSSMWQYIPSDNGKLRLPMFNIEITKTASSDLWEEHKCAISKSRPSFGTETFNIVHLQCLCNDLDSDSRKMVNLLKKLRSYDMSENRVVLMCRNGAESSGLVYTLLLLLDNVNTESCLSIPLILCDVKSVRPEVISTLNQYVYIYKVLHDCFTETTPCQHVYNSLVPADNYLTEEQEAGGDSQDIYVNL